MKGAVFGGIATIVLAWAIHPASAHAQQTSADQVLGASIRQCAILESADDRHACIDDAMTSAGLMRPPTAAADQADRFGQSTPEARRADPEAAPEKRTEYTRRFVEPERVDRIEITLRNVSDLGDGKLILTGENGMVWRQVESKTILPLPRQGQAMTVERAALGSYTCKIGKWTTFRCVRPRFSN